METLADIEKIAEVQHRVPQLAQAARVEELGRIITAYNEVTERLQQSHSQLQQTVQSLRNELSEKNRQLERRQRLAALGEMAAGMAHEIRNPLGGIQLYASLLARDVDKMPPSLQLVEKISAGVKRLEGLVSQVLHFTREIEAHPVETDLAELMDQTLELAAGRAQSPSLRCRAQGRRPMPVRVDPLLLGQAALNLVINAIEAVGPEGTVDVSWTSANPPHHFCLCVRDSGPGIPVGLLDRVFNPFFTTKESGTGLGLAIVHRIVEAHDGTIVVTKPPGGGAMFEMKI
jgi:two-component system sensor histidine kinase HydH